MGAFRLADEFGLRAGHGDVARIARLAVIGGDGGGFFTQLARRFACVVGRGMNSKKAIVVIARKLMQTIRSVWLQDRKYANLLISSKMK